jgi:hypothetical protein
VVRVTAEFLMAGMSGQGGYKRAQLAILGVPWPPKTGWKARVIGMEISQAEADRFVRLGKGEQDVSQQPELW